MPPLRDFQPLQDFQLAAGYILHGRYQIQALLGQGGMGAVYRAHDQSLSRACAVKENLDASAAAQAQFRNEAQILARLRHPHLPQVFDYFIEPNGQQYLVMEFVEGEDLSTLVLRGGALHEAQAVTWISQVLDALDYLHTRTLPIIHRDIKPTNIRLTPEGNALLVDFGIAKVWTAGQATTRGARAITPGYSPPEQYGQGATDARSDIYALGATLYFLVAGAEPTESIQRLTGAGLPPPRALKPALSPRLEQIILRAMELQPAQRFQSARTLKQELTAPAPISHQPSVVSHQPSAVSRQPSSAQARARSEIPVGDVPGLGLRFPNWGHLVLPAVVGNISSVGMAVVTLFLAAVSGGVGSILCFAIPLAVVGMGAWAVQRHRRSVAALSMSEALLDGALAGLLSYSAMALILLCFTVAAFGGIVRSNSAVSAGGGGLISLGVGVVMYALLGASGGVLYRAVKRK